MAYQNIQDDIRFKINALGNQLEDWVKSLNLKNIFELSTFPFENGRERAIVHGMIQRRDAYVEIGNLIETESQSIQELRDGSTTDTVSTIEQMKAISNSFSREIENQMMSSWIKNSKFVQNIVINEKDSQDELAYFSQGGSFEQAIPYLAVLWYNKHKEAVMPLKDKFVEPVEVKEE